MLPPRLEPLLQRDADPVVLATVFADAGHSLYLVGGSVRDALLDRAVEDLDFATDARPEVIKRIVSRWADDMYTMGETFGTIGAIKDDRVYEITTFRSEVYRDDSRKPRVEFSDDIATDLSRRDFTVNAMALRLPGDAGDEPEMVDPHRGLDDLVAQRLRTPLDPHISFGDDPLRMLRLYRFVSTLGFAADRAAVTAVTEMIDRIEIVSAERIRDELNKLLLGDNVETALWGIVNSGLAKAFLPELTALALQQDPQHRHKDVLAHTIAVVGKCRQQLEVRLAALLHDIGTPATREFGPGGVSFHHHEVVGARMARKRLRELRYPKQAVEDVSSLVFLHMRPHTYKMGWTDRAVRRYVRDAGGLLSELNELVRCDVTTRNEKRAAAIARRIDELEARIEELAAKEELDKIRPPIDGNQVMQHLGLEPGPVIGEAMSMLLEHRLDEGPYSEEEAYALLDRWWVSRV